MKSSLLKQSVDGAGGRTLLDTSPFIFSLELILAVQLRVQYKIQLLFDNSSGKNILVAVIFLLENLVDKIFWPTH